MAVVWSQRCEVDSRYPPAVQLTCWCSYNQEWTRLSH